MRDWLEKDSKNVAVIHCRLGKGRTGMMISTLMLELQNITYHKKVEVQSVKEMDKAEKDEDKGSLNVKDLQ